VDFVAGRFLKFHHRDQTPSKPGEYRLAKTLFALAVQKGKKTRVAFIWDDLEAGDS